MGRRGHSFNIQGGRGFLPGTSLKPPTLSEGGFVFLPIKGMRMFFFHMSWFRIFISLIVMAGYFLNIYWYIPMYFPCFSICPVSHVHRSCFVPVWLESGQMSDFVLFRQSSWNKYVYNNITSLANLYSLFIKWWSPKKHMYKGHICCHLLPSPWLYFQNLTLELRNCG